MFFCPTDKEKILGRNCVKITRKFPINPSIPLFSANRQEEETRSHLRLDRVNENVVFFPSYTVKSFILG